MRIRFNTIVLAVACLTAGVLTSCNGFLKSPASSDEEQGSKEANRYLIVDSKFEKYGFIDGSGQVVIPTQYDDANVFRNGLAVVKIGDKYGYINPKGEFVVSPIYEDADPFSEGLAAVSMDDEHYGFVDMKGNMVITPIYNFVRSFSDGVALVRMGDYENGTYMYIDKKGKVVINPVGGNDWEYYSFKKGLARVGVNDKYGFVDKEFKFVVNPMYDGARDFYDGLAAVEMNDRWGFIDNKGKIVILTQYEAVGDFHEGLAAFKVGEKYGFIDKKGNIVVTPQYEEVGFFRNGIAPVQTSEKIGFIDKSGNFVIPPQYDNLLLSDGDLTFVMSRSSDGESDTYSYINKSGNSVWKVVRKYFSYNTGFEASDDCSWTLVNGSEANRWYIGSATAHGGQRSLYISNNGGGGNNYNGNAVSTVYAYQTFTLKSGSYECSFDWRAYGESSFDFMRVSLVPDNVDFTAGQMGPYSSSYTPSDWIDIDHNSRMNGVTDWTTKSRSFYVSDDGTYKLVFMWHNDGSITHLPPAAIDNVMIKENH